MRKKRQSNNNYQVMSLLSGFFGDPNTRFIKSLQPQVDKINALEKDYEKLTDAQLKEKTREFRERFKEGATLDALLPEAFAAVREAGKRALKQRHFDVQLLGAIALHKGQIAEMKTGEGKTLTATLAVYLNALEGKGVHVVTVNDYLAKRDSVWMGQIYGKLGMTTGCLNHEVSYLYDESKPADIGSKQSEEKDEERDEVASFEVVSEYLRTVPRREAYLADITYGTNNEFGFDYLRDNMVMEKDQMVQRDLHYAIIDEVDSILVDEARTPLIISAPAEESTDKYYQFAKWAEQLVKDTDYNVDEKLRAATFTDAGQDKISRLLGFDPWKNNDVSTAHHLEEALRAQALYHNDRDYVIKDDEVVIVDEFTGRLMFGRRYAGGLHQAIEAKENVKIQRESQTLATITFQNLFRMYKKLAGMTGTAVTESEEFHKIYNLEVTVVPPNRIMARKDLPDRVYKNEKGKFLAVVKEIKEHYEKGQPVLVGTISIEKNELLSELLTREGVPHEVLNAKNHEKEAKIIAQAGRLKAVTVATNMAGRGVDIILGGNPSDGEMAARVKEAGGLFVLGTERHESRRIDNQLRGRSGRQGDPGVSQFYISMEDDLMRIFGPMQNVKGMMERMGVPDDMPIENKLVSRSIESAQKKVEGHNFDTRKHLVEYDDVINKHRQVVYKRRRDILELGEGIASADSQDFIKDKILELVEAELEQLVAFHTSVDNERNWDVKEIFDVVQTIFPVSSEALSQLQSIQKEAGDRAADAAVRTKIIDFLMGLARDAYVDLEKRIVAALGERVAFMQMERIVYLRAIDTLWIEHLEAIDRLRHGIGLRGYGQRDPLVEYKKEAFRMFNELLSLIQKEIVYSVYKIAGGLPVVKSLLDRSGLRVTAPAKTSGELVSSGSALNGASGSDPLLSAGGVVSQPIVGVDAKVGRNDPCPCGKTKPDGNRVKFKNCHGEN